MDSERKQSPSIPVSERSGDRKDRKKEGGPQLPWSRLAARLGKVGVIASALLGLHSSGNQENFHSDKQGDSRVQVSEKERAAMRETVLGSIAAFDKKGFSDFAAEGEVPLFVDAYLDKYDAWKDKSYAEQLLNSIISLGAEAAYKRIAVYRDAPYAINIFKVRAESYGFLDFAHQLLGTPYAESLIRKGAVAYPYTFFKNAGKYSQAPFFQNLLIECVKNVQGEYPGLLVETFDEWNSFLPNAHEVLHDASVRAIQLDPSSNIKTFRVLKQFPDAQDILTRSITRLTDTEPTTVLSLYPEYKFLSQSDDIVRRVVQRVILTDPSYALECQDYYRNAEGGRELFERAVRATLHKDTSAVIRHFSKYQDEPYAEEVLREAASIDPRRMIMEFDHTTELMKRSYGMEIVETCALQSPFIASGEQGVLFHLQDSASERVRRLVELLTEQKRYRPFVVSTTINGKDQIYPLKNGTPEETLHSFQTMMRIKADPHHIGDADLDYYMEDYALVSVRTLNDLHNERDAQRFSGVKDYSSEQLYTLMVYGDQELFTSSFNGLFSRMIKKIKTEKSDGTKLLEKVGKNKFRTFVRLCASYNRLDEFLDTLSVDAREELLTDFVRGIEKEKNPLEQAVTIADVFSVVDDKNILKVFQGVIRSEYERVQQEGNREGTSLYGLLAGMFGEKAVINESWIKHMAEKYQLPDIHALSHANLFDKTGTNIQRYFFYGDEDGAASFENFLFTYKRDASWTIQDKKGYVIISKKENGKTIEIFANKPSAENDGNSAIEDLFKKQQKDPHVYVHRGHSYHASDSIEKIRQNAALVSLGSCGGYGNVEQVLARAGSAHIISTKGTGTMKVNDPVFKSLNEEMLKGKDVMWQKFWKGVESRLGSVQELHDYVPPHKNLGVVFLKAYYRLRGVTDADTAESENAE
jgi:hypothetical protein